MAASGRGIVGKAFDLLRQYPRVTLGNIKDYGRPKRKLKPRGKSGGKCGRGNKGQGQRATLPRIGFEGNNTPFYLRIPKEPYYFAHHVRRQYPPFSLLELQRAIDLGRLDTSQPIDLTMLCNTRLFQMSVDSKHFGVQLTDEGADAFAARVNLEVQWTTETVIAAVERNGGTITTRFYDRNSLRAVINPLEFFKKGTPIPRCALPPEDALEYYTDPSFRGYLADPEKVAEARVALAQKYGYELPDLTKDPDYEMLMRRKDPRQLFYGLHPGWVVSLQDRVVLKPKSEEYQQYYTS